MHSDEYWLCSFTVHHAACYSARDKEAKRPNTRQAGTGPMQPVRPGQCVWLFPRTRGAWGKVRRYSPRLRFNFLRGGQLARTSVSLLGRGSINSGSASWDACPDDLRASPFPWRVPSLCLLSARFDFVESKVYCHLHFWQNDRVFFFWLLFFFLRATRVTRKREGEGIGDG